MKKFLLAALVSMFVIPVYADESCNCDGREIVRGIKDATWSGGGVWDFAEAIYNVKDDSSFKSALKYYIESNCTVKDNKIQCK